LSTREVTAYASRFDTDAAYYAVKGRLAVAKLDSQVLEIHQWFSYVRRALQIHSWINRMNCAKCLALRRVDISASNSVSGGR